MYIAVVNSHIMIAGQVFRHVKAKAAPRQKFMPVEYTFYMHFPIPESRQIKKDCCKKF